jgi:hypothetical protein
MALGPVAAVTLATVLAAGCPAAPSHPPAISRAAAGALDAGMREAQTCEGEIDADLAPYVACIEERLRPGTVGPAHRAGVRLQAWVMADLALQQSALGAVEARTRWWRGLQGDLSAARLTLDEVCARRGLDVADIRLRALRRTDGA